MARLCKIIFDDPERDTRVVAYANRYAADRHGEGYTSSGADAAGAPGQRARGMG